MPSGGEVLVDCVQQSCYCRGEKCYRYDDPRDFASRIQVKQNAPELLRRALGKRVVEALANQVYAMELENASSQRIWAYRKAAWAIEDTPQDLGLICRTMGRKGLESIENVGPKMAQVVEDLLSGAPMLRWAREPVSSEWWPP